MNKDELEKCLDLGWSLRKIAREKQLSQTTIIYWAKKHNVSKPIIQKCNYCKTEDESHFKSNGSTSVCKKCSAKKFQKRWDRLKQESLELLGNKCMKCGYNKCKAALEFHHRDPKIKKGGWPQMKLMSKENRIKEIHKCDLLCANCHREEHAKIRKEKLQLS